MDGDWKQLVIAAVAAGGGVAKTVSLWLRGKTEQILLSRTTANGIVSGYSGYACYQIGVNMAGFHEDSGIALAMIGGWAGAEALDFGVDLFKKQIKKGNDRGKL